MDRELFKQAFVRGAYRRAEELGLSKEAFAGSILSGVGRMFGAPILGSMATNKLLQLAMAQKKIPRLAGAAKKWQTLLTAPGAKGMAANIANMTAGDALVSPVLNPIFDKLEGTQPPPPQVAQGYPEYY
jgi:hypothetical protein